MAYNTKELEANAIKILDRDKDIIYQQNDLANALGIAESTFYDKKLDKSKPIKERLQKNKSKVKEKMRQKWIDSDNATLQISGYKLIGTDKERKKLSQAYIDISSNDKELKGLTNLPEINDAIRATNNRLKEAEA